MLTMLKLERERWLTHLALVLFSVIGCVVAWVYMPSGTSSEILSLGTGYVALILLIITLLIGPFNLLRKRRNPVNINLRRDAGIWSGITGILHVVFSFQIYNDGDILSYFLTKGPNGYSLPKFDLFNLSNYVGLIATLVMVVLLITSNQISLRWLKGKRWKLVQRFNYLLFILVLVHTFGYQVLNLREGIFILSVIAFSLITVATQLVGALVWTRRTQQRQAGAATPPAAQPTVPTPQPVLKPGQVTLARRQFLAVGGAAVLGGFTVGILWGRSLTAENTTSAAGPIVAQVPTTATNSSSNATAIATAGATSTTSPPTKQPAILAATTPPTTGTGTTKQPTTTNPTTPAAAATQNPATNTRNVILATTAKLAPGNAIKFTTPDTGESAFLVRESDGSVKAFSGSCTHRPYDLVFSSSQQALVCNLHNVPFDANTGAPRSRPARTALPSFKVQVDGQGSIMYISA